MVCEEYFEVGVVSVVVEDGVDVVIVCASIWGIFYFEVLDEDEVFDDLNSLDLTVVAEEVFDQSLVGILHPTHIKLSDQDAFHDVLGGTSLLS